MSLTCRRVKAQGADKEENPHECEHLIEMETKA